MSEFNVYKYKPPRKLENGYSTDNLVKSLTDRELLRYMGVPQRYWRNAIGLKNSNQKMHPVVEGWFGDMASIYRPLQDAPKDMCGRGLVFYGPGRAGKTITATALLLRLVREGFHNNDPGGYNRWDGWCMGQFHDWQEVSAVLRSGSSGGEAGNSAEALRNSLLSMGPMLDQANFLVLDDISRERGTEFNVGELSRIIRYRGDNGYPTIITTNHRPEEWAEIYQSEGLVGYLSNEFFHVGFEPR